METINIILLILSWLLITATWLPLVKNDYWIFRILEYPRYQKLVSCVLMLAGLLATSPYHTTVSFITAGLLAAGIFYLLYKIWPYTPVAKKEMKSVAGSSAQNQIKVYSANVYQENTCYDLFKKQINDVDPDVLLFLEADQKWEKEMDAVLSEYPHCLKCPLDNTYGMLFYSRLKMVEGEIKYLVEDDVPSIEATLKLPSGQLVKIWGLHPKPPVPGEDDTSTAKDKELMKVAFKAKNETMPVIVMGDLNDVAWSYVTKLFRKTSRLLDPRRGRGFYSTFSSKSWFMRFPLDYVFCSSHFGLVTMRRLNYNGSDHFPMFSHFEFDPGLTHQQHRPKADREEMEASKEKAEQPV